EAGKQVSDFFAEINAKANGRRWQATPRAEAQAPPRYIFDTPHIQLYTVGGDVHPGREHAVEEFVAEQRRRGIQADAWMAYEALGYLPLTQSAKVLVELNEDARGMGWERSLDKHA